MRAGQPSMNPAGVPIGDDCEGPQILRVKRKFHCNAKSMVNSSQKSPFHLHLHFIMEQTTPTMSTVPEERSSDEYPEIQASKKVESADLDLAAIFRGVTDSTDSMSSEQSHEWPLPILSNISSDYSSPTEETRELPPEEQILQRSNPIMIQHVLSDAEHPSIKTEVSVPIKTVTGEPPFYTIQFDKEGNKAQVFERAATVVADAPTTKTTFTTENNALNSTRKRTRSKENLLPRARQMMKALEEDQQNQASKENITDNFLSSVSHLERFAEAIEFFASPSTICAAATKPTNLGMFTPWHSSSSMRMHDAPTTSHSPNSKKKKATTPFHNKSYLATTVSTCRAF